MKELENLLNSLIQRGWKPFGNSNLNHCNSDGKFIYFYTIRTPNKPIERLVYESLAVPLRSITAIESGLWQFVCENSLIKQCKGTICKNPKVFWNLWSIQWEWWYWCDIAEYRLLESALIPEEELGKFLVENIIITWNSK